MSNTPGLFTPPDEEPLEHTDEWFWRCAQYLRLGFNAGQAQQLADARADYRQVGAAVARGCPLKTAVAIFT